MSISVFFQDGQRNRKLGTLTVFTLTLDVALMQVYHLLHVSQAKSEALHVMLVTSMHTIELIEYLLHVLFLDALPRIANAQVQLLAIVPRVDIDVEWFVLLTTKMADSTASICV